MGIFSDNAPKLWALGLPVMPLYPREKSPVVNAWQQFAERMPSPEEQAFWLKNYPDGNIGLPLGPQSGCVALDIDTEDERLYQLVCSLVPSSPWNRVGNHGKVMLFKYTGQKTFRIKDIEGVTICELLSAKTQVVIPPSIHPKTQKPYVADAELSEVIDKLPVLDPNIETILRQALMDNGVTLSHTGWTRTTDYISKGSRDVKMTSLAGFFANGVTRGEISVKEAINRMYAWYSSCVEKVAGDDVDIDKGIKNMLSFLAQDVIGPKGKTLPKGWDEGLTDEEKTQMGLNFDIELEEWDYERLRNYLYQQFSQFADDSIQRADAVEYILKRIARSPNLTSLEIDRILKYISQACKNFQLSALKKRLNELKTGDVRGTDHTEIAKAVIQDLHRSTDVRFHLDKMWKWTGSHWEVLPDQELYERIANDFGHLPAASRANDHLGILRVIKNILPQGLVPNGLDPIKGVNFANGLVDMEGVLHQHSPNFGMTYTMPFRYIPELGRSLDNAPRFKQFLTDVWGDEPDFEQRVKALRQVMAATMFGIGTSFSRAVLLYGIAGSGKSQMLEIMKNLLPPKVVSYITPYDFDDRFKVTELSRSIMNICGELQRDRKIPSAHFKQIMDSSDLSGQYKGRQLFDFKPVATHWFASNYLPKSDDETEGFNRRWLIFSFNKIPSPEKKVRDLGSIIVAEEREAIASWVIGEIMELKNRSEYTIPESHYRFVSEMASENDTLFFFLTSDKGPRKMLDSEGSLLESTKIHIDKLYEEYTTFCYGSARVRPVGLKRYVQRLRELSIFMGFKVDSMTVFGLTMDKGKDTLIKSVPLVRNF